MNKSSRPRNIIPKSRWTAYASAGLATAFGSACAAQAEIHYSGPVKQVLDVGSHSTILYTFPLQSGAHLLFDFARFGGGPGSAIFEITGAAVAESFRGSRSRYPAKLGPGDLISAGTFFPGNEFNTLVSSRGRGVWSRSTPGFVGFRFDNGSGFQYGWARVRIRRDHSFIVVDYAWGDPGEAVTAGQKESSLSSVGDASLGSLALGAAGVTAWRKARDGEPNTSR